MTRSFAVDMGWAALLAQLDIRPGDLLRRAQLPEDLFTRPRATLEPDAFFRLWKELLAEIDGDTPILTLTDAMSAEVFSPPLYAAFCSPNLLTALQRLANYKPLICPMKLELVDSAGGVEVSCNSSDIELPSDYLVGELCFLLRLARLGTKSEIKPLAVEMAVPPREAAYADFFGRTPRTGPFNRIVFSRQDALRPFVAANPALFAAFEPDLQARLDQLRAEASFEDRVRAVLMEALPSGRADTGEVARRLGLSQRSLQRKLALEGTSFKALLQSLRTRLAEKYLGQQRYAISEIAFLLGYEDPNSFYRAFHAWTGKTPDAVRRSLLGN